jgi:chitodextrinase
MAYDTAGNTSGLSNSASVSTPAASDTTSPTAPTTLAATAVSSSQINLNWSASTDNVGVTGYDVYRNGTKIATSTTTSFGDTGLSASTSYSYYLIARDAAGNSSTQSATVSAVTQPAPVSTGNLIGVVNSTGGKPIAGAIVSLSVNGALATYTTASNGSYSISNLPAGSYRVTYSASGYASKTMSVSISSGQTTTQNVALKKH